ncbi:MAG: MerR family transcriptional regulator [Calditrichaeota bacterium]|nr:MAG: MerR family transcriptional regulator [Calditrichota bacterium]
MHTISKLAAQFGLSRSTLLYYDSIGLLEPDQRSEKGYRLYSEQDRVRLEEICMLRETGLSLERVQEILDSDGSNSARILKDRLFQLNDEINTLRHQQDTIVKLIGDKSLQKHTRNMSKNQWVHILKSAGMNAAGMLKWHQEFERTAPEAHQDFLESIGLDAIAIARIRKV